MTDYVKSTSFASKDSLASGNPLKIVKGTEIDTEFNNIATAIATKANSASPSFSGTPTAPTQDVGDNTTKIANTAFVTSAIAAERSASTTLSNKTLVNPTFSGLALSFEGSTENDFETALTVVDPTADRTITLPDATTTVVGTDVTQTLTNKTVNLLNNTLTGTKTQFNTACSDDNFSFSSDFSGSNQSLTSTGYQKLPGGLILQWGTFTSTVLNSSTSVTFVIPFPNACLQVIAGVGTSRTDQYAPGVFNIALTGCQITNNNAGTDIKWLAIGY